MRLHVVSIDYADKTDSLRYVYKLIENLIQNRFHFTLYLLLIWPYYWNLACLSIKLLNE